MQIHQVALAMLVFVSPIAAAGQEDQPSQLDFIAGKWSIHDASGETVGRSDIVVQAPGAMIYEKRTVGDAASQHLWFENSERNGGWTQLFVGPAGMVREFKPLSPSRGWPLVLGADVTLQNGADVRFRMTLSSSSVDESKRLLQMSRDKGKTWSTVFDYTYRRATPKAQ